MHARPPTDRARPLAARAVLAITGVLSVGSVATWWAAAPPWHPWMLYSLVDLVVGAIYGVVAWLTLSRRAHLAAWITAAAGVGGAVSAAAAAFDMVRFRWPDLDVPLPLAGIAYWAWVPGFYALAVVLPWLLPVRPLGRAARAAVGVGVAFIVVAQVCAVTVPGVPWALSLTGPAARVRATVDPWLEPVLVLLALVAAAGVLWRRRAAPPARRHGLGWLAVGTLLLAGAFVPLALNPLLPVRVPTPSAPLLMLGAQAFFPASVLVVVLRQRLWGLELVVRRTLVWALMTALVIATYVGGVLALRALLPASSAVPEVVVTASLAAAFQPLRHWVQRRVDRLVHGDTGQPLMRQVADRLRATDGGTQMLDAVAGGIAAALRLAEIRIVLAGGPGCVSPTAVALVNGDRRVGTLHAWPRPGERLDGRAAAALTDLAPVVTALAELAAAQHDLERSRQGLARARDEERRKLRRDLHDGLGPALSGVSLALAAGRNLLRPHRHLSEVAATDELLDQLVAEVDRQAAGVREIARDLLPPLLDDGALGPALDRLRERYAAAGLTVRVHAPPLRLPEEEATAVYGIVAEAVRNVHRHAGVERCAVDVSTEPDGLTVSVADHGVGIGGAAGSGVGTRAMRERAEAIGAELTIGPARAGQARPGTRVCLRLRPSDGTR
ncbi:histidine kinase [Micromonospora echinospora]|uniref:sensor histidine kinase n=1 Tax=Micromonospora echinospora TaxID=1877 RepID=UPI003671AF29